MRVVDCVQGDPEWLEARRYRVTASRLADAVSFLKRGDKQGEESAGRAKYKAEMVGELLSGVCADHYVSPWMERGMNLEPRARTAYELRYGVMVQQLGFVIHPTIDRAGASPDGIVPGVRGVEFKCPKIDTHIGYLLGKVLPREYEPQVMWNLACCRELPEWDFISYCPEVGEQYQLFRVPVKRNEARIAELEAGVLRFLEDVDDVVAALRTLYPEDGQFKKQLKASVEAEGGITDEDIAWIQQQHEAQLGGSHV